MRHCCQFKADDIYYLEENDLYINRKLSIGFCPICQKPVAELFQESFAGKIEKNTFYGVKANKIAFELKDEIKYSMCEYNYLKFKTGACSLYLSSLAQFKTLPTKVMSKLCNNIS